MMSDAAFQILSITAIAATIVCIAIHFACCGRKRRAAGPSGGAADMQRLGGLTRLAVIGTAVTGLVLAVTGLAPTVVFGERLEGYMLMCHVGCGGAFAVLLALTAALLADDCRFRSHDAKCCTGEGGGRPSGKFDAGQKTAFWLLLALGLVAVLTMVLSMLPIFGPDGLELMRDIHRCCGLLMLLVALVHCYQTMTVCRGRWSSLLSGKVNSDWARHYRSLWWQAVRGEEGK